MDSSAQASPIQPAPAASPTDSSAEASPVTPSHTAALSIAARTPIPVRLVSSIDSGHLKNGDTVPATLAQPLALSPHGTLPAGTPAALTVIETLPAGRIYAVGEFSLQLLRVGSLHVFTDTLTYLGKSGHKDLPDSAPALGTDAGLPAGAELTFHVLPPPATTSGPPQASSDGPGSVSGVAPGDLPPHGSSSQQQPQAPSTSRPSTQRSSHPGNKVHTTLHPVAPPTNTPQPAQTSGQPSPAPGQPVPPQNATPAGSTQPR